MAYTVEYSAGQGVKRHLRSINAVYGEKTASAVDYAVYGERRHLRSINAVYDERRHLRSINAVYGERWRLRSNNGLAETPPDARCERLGRRTVSAERKLNSETNWHVSTV